MVNFFFTKYMAYGNFSELNALIPKIPFSIFADHWVWVTSEAQVSVSVGFWGSRQLSPFGGGGLAKGLYCPPPPFESLVALVHWFGLFTDRQ